MGEMASNAGPTTPQLRAALNGRAHQILGRTLCFCPDPVWQPVTFFLSPGDSPGTGLPRAAGRRRQRDQGDMTTLCSVYTEATLNATLTLQPANSARPRQKLRRSLSTTGRRYHAVPGQAKAVPCNVDSHCQLHIYKRTERQIQTDTIKNRQRHSWA